MDAVRFAEITDSSFHVAWKDGERVFCRGWHKDSDGSPVAVLAVRPSSEHPHPGILDRFTHEYAWKDELDRAWAACPFDLLHEGGQTVLLLEDPGGEPLANFIGAPMEVESFLQLAIGIAGAVGNVHKRGFVHKDIKPANILVNCTDQRVRLTGFGIASRLPRERQKPEPPELVAGTLAYMAPEQTGRINRSIDSRSDLYALGVTLYQILTGSLPFTAADPVEWVHCHIARKPLPPSERLENFPAPVSEIIMKLLAKASEERYQTAAGLERDLRRCLAEWGRLARIAPFALGQYDVSDRLLIPERLYGRAYEIETLLAAFDRVVGDGGPELVLVSGYSGIGKSSVVHELHRALVPPHGLFAAGKFDQYKRDIPYATLAQALQSLIRPLLGKSDTELAPWREALREALGANAQVMATLIPELEPLIGLQMPVPELPPQDAQRRFQLAFRQLLGVFARPEHPLALFLDDLQWLDAATLDLVEHLATQSELRHLLLVGAYRDNEVTPAHPLMRRLAAIRDAGGRLQEIVLAPLRLEDVIRLIADALQCTPDRAGPLSRLVHEKTGGNPFFTSQFLSALAEEGLLAVDHGAARWTWDLEQIHAKGYTDNVVDLMLGKLRSLPAETRETMQHLACLGSSAPISALVMVGGGSEEKLHAALWAAIQAGLVLRQGENYNFLHDRVQEAAYALIPKEEQAAQHLAIGRLLVAHTPPEKREEAIFEIANHLNRGTALINSAEEREQVAELNLIAGQRAKQSTAYHSALAYLAAGCALLPLDCWDRCNRLTFALEFHRAECEFLTGALAAAEERLSMLSSRAGQLVDFAAVTRLRQELFLTVGKSGRAIEVCLGYLRRVGIEWSAHPMEEAIQQEYERLWRRIGPRSIEDLIDLPIMEDPEWRATMDVLTAVVTAALFTDKNLLCLVICRMANISLEHGNSDGSCFAYAWLGTILGPHFGDYRAGYRFGKLGLDLVEQRALRRFEARVYVIFGHRVIPWTQPIRTGRPLVRRAFDAANKLGDLTFAAFSRENLITNLLATGEPLAEVQREAEAGLDGARQARFGLLIDRITTQLGFIRSLRGLTPELASFNHAEFDEIRFEQHLGAPHLATAASRYWTRKLQARFFAGDYTSAMDAAERAEGLVSTSSSLSIMLLERAEYHLYAALARAACCQPTGPDPYTEHQAALAMHEAQLRSWATNCPDNFENCAALVSAEIARLEGRELDAARLYELAIRSARTNSFVHNEALASELAARFYAARGLDINSDAHLRKARQCYESWGADGKVRQLDQVYPYLRNERDVIIATGTIGAPVEHLDLATIIKVSQAVSSEIVPEKLIDTLMHTAMEQAGAERGLLILARGATPRIAAEAITDQDMVVVYPRDEAATESVLPESVLRYVLHSRESIILDDAATQSPFAADPYIRDRRARSVLGLPLINQGKLVGALYLENNLTPNAFAPARMTALKLLASQAAISLENSRLYGDLQEREAKIRQLVDANIIGIIIWDFEGRIIEANDTFLRMLGFDRDDFVSGHLDWIDLTPPQWRSRSAEALEDLKNTGTIKPYEREYFRKDGSRVPVLIGAARLEQVENQGVSFVLDLTERRQAESEARDSERRYRETQMELAHANRVATMGQLTASIAHEVNQPITAMIGNAEASLRWLDRRPPDLEEVRRLLERIAKDGRRVGNVIDRTRDLVKKAPLRMERMEINEAIDEVIELTRGEAAKNHISVQTQFAGDLPPVGADRTQLQQVMLNLIINAVHALSDSEVQRELFISTSMNDSGGVLVSVRDSGKGMMPEQIERLFDPFYSTKPGGMGMGLSICRSIVESHGGRIWATADLPHGATFHFTIPQADNVT
ncbi:trifunctional serine/threonine-protein kinase/ATP-binding protein/sensor histidine kinase [Bradyrhizobium iriomotense]|uniref:histidine kinase n=1 Tax=Bradyrhizobium iriomotense TaxID=441950 RepID=A0ABQ6AZE5_9BRAD|nr:ATP-binding sensor histidine kinase [Bradyrhizobium iriomotense]GLR85262.1 signal transduction histidine kinase [Bradyrhizobium iriomotense]